MHAGKISEIAIGYGASACSSGGIVTPYTSLACGSSGKFLAYSEQQDWDNHWKVGPWSCVVRLLFITRRFVAENDKCPVKVVW